MAKMSIYVPDGLKAEMDQIDSSRANWSSAAQRAFEQEMQKLKWPKEPTMENVIERLRASKEEAQATDGAMGVADGKKWAMESATYTELKAAAKALEICEDELDKPSAQVVVARVMAKLMKDDDYAFWGEDEEHSPDYVRGILEGAAQVWEEVEGQL